jgi:type I restriction enzyme, S subunit
MSEGKTLGNQLQILSGFPFPSTDFTSERNGEPLIRIRDLQQQNPETYFSGDYDSSFLVSRGDVLVGMDGDFNAVKWQGPQALLNQRVCKITTKDPAVLNQDFLYHSLQPHLNNIHKGTAQTTVKHLSTKDLYGIDAELPPLPEQRKIAEILSGIGRQSTLYQQKIDAVISEKKALLNSLFRTPFEGNALLQELCEEDICYGVLQYNEAGEATIPVIQIRNLEPLNLTNTKMIPLSLDQKYSRSRVIANDLLVSVKGSVGKIAVIPKGFSGNISRDIARVRTRTSVVLPHFLKHWFASDPGCDALSRIEVGTTRAELSIGKMRTLRISYPSLEKQEEICRIANSLDETLSSLSKQVEKYDLLKQAIGSDLLSGRKRVTI